MWTRLRTACTAPTEHAAGAQSYEAVLGREVGVRPVLARRKHRGWGKWRSYPDARWHCQIKSTWSSLPVPFWGFQDEKTCFV